MKTLKQFCKLIKKVFNVLLEIIKETYYLYFIKNNNNKFERIINYEDHNFLEINKKYWNNILESTDDGYVLVEGFFSQSGNNYLLRTGMLAKAIHAQTGCEPVVLFNSASHKQVVSKKKYESFGIKKFFYIKPDFTQLLLYVRSIIVSFKIYLHSKNINDLVKITYQEILLGDLIYDDILKFDKTKKTISEIDRTVFLKIIHALYFYFSYVKIFKKNKIKYLISTHTMYSEYGILARVALHYGADVIETNDLMVNHLKVTEYATIGIAPCYHVILRNSINNYLKNSNNKLAFIELAESDLCKRFSGNVEQFDSRLAYKNKLTTTKDDFKRKMGLSDNNNFPIVIIFCHIFKDAPHASEMTLFRDYYDWLNQTLNLVAHIKNVNWVVKPHPSTNVYEEQGMVESLIAERLNGLPHKNIYLFPEGVSSKNLYQIADAIVTVHGTAGIEFSCFGMPVILAGRPFYSNNGFTIDPKTKKEYFQILKEIHKIEKLSPEKIMHAKEIYGAYVSSTLCDSHIIKADVLDAIWGYGDNKANIELGNKKINDRLINNDPKKEPQYLKVLEYLGS